MALPVIGPFALKFMVQPFSGQWSLIGDDLHHGLFEALHILLAGVSQFLPVFAKLFCVIRLSW